ncbi:MAG: DUF4834 family protein [Cyclobacteriaceae bacterium]|nr:DUF4834 family protein [Cyclobacteriaceae bacterium]
MLKFFAILALLYFFFRSIGHVLRLVLGRSAQTRTRQNPYSSQGQQRASRGGLHVDSAPNRQKKKTDFKGGDYVDYEEVE